MKYFERRFIVHPAAKRAVGGMLTWEIKFSPVGRRAVVQLKTRGEYLERLPRGRNVLWIWAAPGMVWLGFMDRDGRGSRLG
jgi:hypothetical protein